MPKGKPAGLRCVNLSPDARCLIFGHPERPDFCVGLKPSPEMCGRNPPEALAWLQTLEELTRP